MKPDVLKAVLDRLQAELNRANFARVIQQADDKQHARQLLSEKLQLEPSRRKLIDEACRRWAERNQWPMMDDVDAFLVWERLYEGFLLGVLLHDKGGLRAGRKTEAQLIVFLTIDMWEPYGLYRVKSQLNNTQ